jgi:membrane dipeptidase
MPPQDAVSAAFAQIHRDALVLDALNICDFSRQIFDEWGEGGVTAVSCTCAVWENARDTLHNLAAWRRRFEENADRILQVRSTADILRAKQEAKTGVILSWQNTSPFEDRLDFVGLFSDLGVGIAQLTYNTQNYSGAGYQEAVDPGLSGFGREMVAEMNRVGMLIDLSHVGDRTSADTIAAARGPVAFTHILPRALKDTARNKPDELIRAVAERGGFVGLSLFSPGLAVGNDATVEHWLDAMEHVIAVAGASHVGIGTDFSQGHPRPGSFLQWCNMDKGYARELTRFGNVKIEKPKGFARIREFPNATAAMLRRGWSEESVRGILGGNLLRVLRCAWNETTP